LLWNLAVLEALHRVPFVQGKGDGDMAYRLRKGPFQADFFSSLPESHWQLLVRGVDRQVPEVADILNNFDMVPKWLLDDIMISFAAPHGGIGPHTDSFDVFLVQGIGEKEWSIMSGSRISPEDDSKHVKVYHSCFPLHTHHAGLFRTSIFINVRLLCARTPWCIEENVAK
jgi:ribosomal protein L16 Arg81 hydroxylase